MLDEDSKSSFPLSSPSSPTVALPTNPPLCIPSFPSPTTMSVGDLLAIGFSIGGGKTEEGGGGGKTGGRRVVSDKLTAGGLSRVSFLSCCLMNVLMEVGLLSV